MKRISDIGIYEEWVCVTFITLRWLFIGPVLRCGVSSGCFIQPLVVLVNPHVLCNLWIRGVLFWGIHRVSTNSCWKVS